MIACTNIVDFYRMYARLLSEGKDIKWYGRGKILFIVKKNQNESK